VHKKNEPLIIFFFCLVCLLQEPKRNVPLEQFKQAWVVRQIRGIIESGRPLAAKWCMPPFMFSTPDLLNKFLGKRCANLYRAELSEDDKKGALDFISNCGEYISGLVRTPVWEDWDGSSKVQCDLDHLLRNHASFYEALEVSLDECDDDV
jgi:hypothetical protein